MAKVRRTSVALELPASIEAAAARLAKEDGVSLNQWIASAVAQKVGAVETAASFFEKRAGDAKLEDLRVFLRAAPDMPPAQEDELDSLSVRQQPL